MFTIIIPFYKGAKHLFRLLLSMPKGIENVVIVDDSHDGIDWLKEFDGTLDFIGEKTNVYWTRTKERGYFAGAVNHGIEFIKGVVDTDYLVLNQDIEFTDSDKFWKFVEENKTKYDSFGERAGEHPLFPNGYIHGVFWYIKKDAWDKVGKLDEKEFPIWGGTAYWCLLANRKGLKTKAFKELDFIKHKRSNKLDIGGSKIIVGDAIKSMIGKGEIEDRKIFANVPLVSVVVTCKNYGKYLPDLIGSLIGGKTSLGDKKPQTLQNFEIVIVNDGSTDDSKDIIEKYVKMDIGVRAIHNGKSLGTADAYNAGIKAALGSYISVLDGDDMMEYTRLEKLLTANRANPKSMIWDDALLFAFGQPLRIWEMKCEGDTKDKDGKVTEIGRDYVFENLLEQNHIHAGIFFPKQAWIECGGYPSSFSSGRQDWAMNIALGRVGWCGVRIPEPLYLYRREQQGRTMKNGTKAHHDMFLQKIKNTFPDLYSGKEFPMGCCGGRGSRARTGRVDSAKAGLSRSQQKLAGSNNGLVLIRYNGNSNGLIPVYGKSTGTKYYFSKIKSEVYVDARDIDYMLNYVERGVNLFTRAVPLEEKKVSVNSATAF